MRIVIIEPSAHLAGHYTNELGSFCRHLVRRVSAIDVLTPFGFRERLKVPSRCNVHALLGTRETYRSQSSSLSYRLYNFQWDFYREVSRFLAGAKYDAVHLWGYKSVFPIWKFLRQGKEKLVMTLKAVRRSHDAVAGFELLGRIQEKISYFVIPRIAKAYVVHTTSLREQALALGIPAQNIHLIPTGIEVHRSRISKLKSRQQLRLPRESIILLIFGALREEKGILEVLRYCCRLPRGVFLYLVGEDWTKGGIEPYLRSIGIRERVLLHLSYVPEEDVEKYFQASDAVIVSHQRSFVGESGVLLRAIEYQKPVIGVSHGYTGEIVRTYGIGSIFDIGSEESFIKATMSVLKDFSTLKTRWKALQRKMDWGNLVKRYADIYQAMRSNMGTSG